MAQVRSVYGLVWALSKNEPTEIYFPGAIISLCCCTRDDMQIIKHSHEDIFIVPTDTLSLGRGTLHFSERGAHANSLNGN